MTCRDRRSDTRKDGCESGHGAAGKSGNGAFGKNPGIHRFPMVPVKEDRDAWSIEDGPCRTEKNPVVPVVQFMRGL